MSIAPPHKGTRLVNYPLPKGSGFYALTYKMAEPTLCHLTFLHSYFAKFFSAKSFLIAVVEISGVLGK